MISDRKLTAVSSVIFSVAKEAEAMVAVYIGSHMTIMNSHPVIVIVRELPLGPPLHVQ